MLRMEEDVLRMEDGHVLRRKDSDVLWMEEVMC